MTAPGPPKAIGKGLFTNALLAMLFTERYVAGRSMNSLVTGLNRQGADVAPGTLAGACAQAGALLAPLEDAITARSRRSWHLHADETTWRVFAPRDGDGPARWWLWVFLGADTACFVMDATRSGAVLARHAGIDEKTGQLTPDDDDGEPRRLVISSDFYAVYQSAGKKAGGLVNLYCWAHIRRYLVRAGDANPAQLAYWTAAWLELIKDLYAAHAQLTTAWAQAAAPAPREAAAAAARLEEAGAAWDEAISVIDEARKKQMTAPGLQEPAKKALATLDREWEQLAQFPDIVRYFSGAADEVVRILKEISQENALPDDAAGLAQRFAGQADRLNEIDPYYWFEFGIAGGTVTVTAHAHYPGADQDRPITMTATLQFDDSPGQQQAREAFAES